VTGARLLAAALGFMLLATAARAQEGAFVEHRLALQLSDGTPEKEALVLSVANNVLKQFGPDKVAVEVVAFGPGIDLLRAGNANAVRVDSLAAQGVRFAACAITIETIERESGKPFPLSLRAHTVPAGVPELMLLAEHGYTLVRP